MNNGLNSQNSNSSNETAFAHTIIGSNNKEKKPKTRVLSINPTSLQDQYVCLQNSYSALKGRGLDTIGAGWQFCPSHIPH